jgi:TRAP transporter TAXI family solute receptor
MKRTVRLLALLLVAALLATGCGTSASSTAVPSTATPGTSTASPAPVKKTSYAIGSSGATGAQYIISAAMASEINKHSDRISIDVQATSGASESVQYCESGENGFAVCSAGTGWGYYYGKGYIDPADQTKNVVGVMALQITNGQLIASKESKITSWADLKGKKVCLGTTSASVHSISKAILKQYGINWETDLASAELLSQSEMTEKLSDGDLDAIFMMAAVPTSAVMNLFATEDKYVYIDADPAILQKVIDEEYDFLTVHTVPAGTYSGVDYDCRVLADRSTIACNINLPEEDVYEFCKQTWDNWEVIQKGHATLPDIDMKDFDLCGYPLHPGAEKFYAEMGILG